jgi:fatty acid desaturase
MTEDSDRPRFIERTQQPATKSDARRSWATVLIVFGVIFTVAGLVAATTTGPLAIVGAVLLVGGLILRYIPRDGMH